MLYVLEKVIDRVLAEKLMEAMEMNVNEEKQKIQERKRLV